MLLFDYEDHPTPLARKSQGEKVARLAEAKDTQQFLDWSLNTAGNLYDKDAALAPSTLTFVSEDGQGPVAYCPFQRPVFMEALAIRPKASILSVACALKDLAVTALRLAKTVGAGEVYCYCDEPTTQAYMERHGFERMPYVLYRLRASTAQERYGELEPLK